MISLKKNNSFIHTLFQQRDNSALILFRIAFGFLLFYHCIHFIYSGKLYENFIQPPFTFTYIGFEFLQPLPGYGMYFYFGLMALLGLMIMAGAWYRLSMFGFAILWTIVYLMQKSNYNNHYYLMLLLSWVMCFMPAHHDYSVDANRNRSIRKITCPQWVYFLMMAQTAVIYFYAAISKLNADWLSGKFISLQFARLHTRRFTGFLYSNEYFQTMIVYGGFLFDLLIVPLLLWRKTRYFAFAFYCLFHLFNSYSFRIGIFPYLSIALGLFFLESEKLSQLFFKQRPAFEVLEQPAKIFSVQQKILLLGVCVYLAIQILLPLRSAFYPGNVFWTEEGYRMSWKMMLRTKTGKIHFKIVDPASGKIWIDDPADRFTASHVNWLAICPDITWQYAQQLKKEYSKKGMDNVAVYAIDSVSLNKDPHRLLIDTTVNLAAVKWQRFTHADWILPYRRE